MFAVKLGGYRVIVGIGMDLVDTSQIEQMLHKESRPFIQSLLTSREMDIVEKVGDERRRAEWIAGRYAAKEALLKALGLQRGEGIGMQDIEVLPESSGRPYCHLSAHVIQRIGFPVVCNLTITHTASTAGAMVVVERVASAMLV